MPKVTTPRIDPRQQARVIAMCADIVNKRNGAINFDAIYRSLVEQGIEPDTAHLALERYMHDAMMKRTKKPRPSP